MLLGAPKSLASTTESDLFSLFFARELDLVALNMEQAGFDVPDVAGSTFHFGGVQLVLGHRPDHFARPIWPSWHHLVVDYLPNLEPKGSPGLSQIDGHRTASLR